MNFTDITFFTIIVVLSIVGYYRGLLRTLIGPLSLIIGYGTAYLVYTKTHELIYTLIAVFFGPIFFGWLANTIINHTIFRKKIPEPSLLSRVLGSAFNFCWGCSICVLLLVMLILFPLDTVKLQDLNDNARASQTYKLLKHPLEFVGVIPADEAKECISNACFMSKTSQEELEADKDMQEIMNDPRLKKIMSNPMVQNAIATKNYGAIITIPEIMELGEDPAFVAKALKVYPKIRSAEKFLRIQP